jgi:hypothetical protein
MPTSNIKDVTAWLENFVAGFNFLRPGTDQNLGRDLAHVVAGRISERATQRSRGADPSPWRELTDKPAGKGYKSRKQKAYGWAEADGKPNVRTGQMVSEESCMGDTRVGEQLVEIHYGEDRPPAKTHSPVDRRTPSQIRGDEKVTDRQKAGYAVELDRSFFEVDDDIEAAVIEEARLHLEHYILTEG